MKTQPQIEQSSDAKTNGEAGFLLVFAAVMVALVLIAMAVALPVMAKQLRRDKEVESMHRMQQYVRAIQLFQRACKCTNYPPSMEALEKGVNVRYLRKEYVDPLTGKSDWRLIHNPQTTVKGFFGAELTGLPTGIGTGSNSISGTSTPGSTVGATTPGMSGPITSPTTPGSGAPGSTGSCSTVNAGGLASGFNGAQACNNGSSGSTGSSSDTGMFGDSSGGPIKGVGTSRSGNSILTPNEQTTYETWEFWYDPRIELLKKNVNILGGGGPQGAASMGSTDATKFGSGVNGSGNNGTGTTTTNPGSTTPH